MILWRAGPATQSQEPAVKITKVRVFSTYESCERTTFYVELTTEEGFTITPDSFRTGSVYTNHEGLSIDEARDRALMQAGMWCDLLKLLVEPYVEDGKVIEPSMALNIYETQRVLADRKVARARAAAK